MTKMIENRAGWTRLSLLAGAALLIGAASASAQTGGMAGGGIGGGGIGGGGIVGGGGGGMAGGGGTAGGGGFAGGTSFGGGTTFGGGSSNSGASGGGGALGFAGGAGGAGVQGNANRAGAGAAGATGTGVQATNAFRTYYANPYSLGYPGGTGRTTFGQPVYTLTTTTGAGLAGALTAAPGGLVFATSFPTRRAPAYVTAIGFEHEPPSSKKLEVELQDVIDRSSALRSKAAIRIKMLGQVAVLQGRVTDARSRRLAESLVRLTPGVRGVQNQLAIIKNTP